MSPDGKLVASVGDTDKLFLVKVATSSVRDQQPTMVFGTPEFIQLDLQGNNERQFGGDTHHSSQYIAWNSDSTFVAVSSDSSNVINIVDVRSKTVTQKIDSAGGTYAIAFSPADDNLLAFSMRSHCVHIMNIKTAQRQIIPVPEAINGLAFRPDGQQLVLATHSQLRLYDRVGVKSMFTLCVRFIQRNLSTLESQLRGVKLPHEIQTRLFPLAPRASF